MIVILVSFENKDDAEKVAHYLIEKRLAACVSLIPVKSYYFWKGKKLTPDEIEAIVKTKRENFAKIQEAIEKLLSYEVPQLIAVDVNNVNDKYRKWLKELLK